MGEDSAEAMMQALREPFIPLVPHIYNLIEMSERKYKFTTPKNHEERIEAIYEELCLSPKTNDRQVTETLKDHVAALLAQLKKVDLTKDDERKFDDYRTQSALSVLAFIAAVFLWHGWWNNASDWQLINDLRFPLRLWGIALAAVYTGVVIERSALFSKIWKYGFTKVVSSIAFSALLIFSTGKASSLINALFGVDASAFPFTRAFITGILAFQYLSPLLIVVAFFAVIHAFDIVGYVKHLRSDSYRYVVPPISSIVFLIFSIVILAFSYQWTNRDFSDDALPGKIYRLAHLLDFNSRHSCVNLKEGISLVFVGSDQSKVLVDTSGVRTDSVESFMRQGELGSVSIPGAFYFLPCIPGIRPSTQPTN